MSLRIRDVGVVGCGFAGSATALFLARAGHRVTVYERAPEPAAVGAGILLQPSGLAVLQRLGLLEQVLARGARIDSLCCRTERGVTLFELVYQRLAVDIFGLGMHRGALFELLFGELKTAGVRVHTGVLGWLVIILAGILVNSAFAGISQAIALLTRREATMIAVANFIGLPLLFLSTTMIARPQMPGWMQTAAKFNPVDWGVRAAREVVLPGTDWGSVAGHLGLLLALSALTAAWATRTFRAYQRTL